MLSADDTVAIAALNNAFRTMPQIADVAFSHMSCTDQGSTTQTFVHTRVAGRLSTSLTLFFMTFWRKSHTARTAMQSTGFTNELLFVGNAQRPILMGHTASDTGISGVDVLLSFADNTFSLTNQTDKITLI